MLGFHDSNEIALNNRKNKVLSFIEKDNFIINNYESAPFKNKNHAIECLIPYHLFQVMADDIKFKGSDVEVDLNKEAGELHDRFVDLIEDTMFNDDSFASQLLLYHEQRYINSIMKPNKPTINKKKKDDSTKQSGSVRLPKSPALHAYGTPSSLHIKKSVP